jgi:hypothetical protein
MPARWRISGARHVAERGGQPPRYPLTADLAGVLEFARHDRAPAHGGGDASAAGVGARRWFASREAWPAALRFRVSGEQVLRLRLVFGRREQHAGGNPAIIAASV